MVLQIFSGNLESGVRGPGTPDFFWKSGVWSPPLPKPPSRGQMCGSWGGGEHIYIYIYIYIIYIGKCTALYMLYSIVQSCIVIMILIIITIFMVVIIMVIIIDVFIPTVIQVCTPNSTVLQRVGCRSCSAGDRQCTSTAKAGFRV